MDEQVAPHAGAWIETRPLIFVAAGAVVAPHAGAWIETIAGPGCQAVTASPPTRGRGLKHVYGNGR